jgi:pteridine reductase
VAPSPVHKGSILKSKRSQAPIALITGAARRIGAAIAQHLHAAGFRVVIHYLHSEIDALSLTQKLNQLEKQSALAIKADLQQKNDIFTLITDAVQWGNRLDLLVNNASVFLRDEETDERNWNILFNTNVKAPFYLSEAAYPHLAKECGSIINITDVHADKPLKGYGIYCQTQAALTMQTKSLAREFAPAVRVNAIAPGAIAWPENDNELNASLKRKIISKTPLSRHGTPENIAQAVLSFVGNNFVTGQVLRVDGGRSLI